MRTLYHSTNVLFDKLSTDIGIGLHLGTKKAASQRLSTIGEAEFQIDHVAPSQKDLNCLKIQSLLDFTADQSHQDRISRAKSQGFDVSRVYYHGTCMVHNEINTDINGFSKSKIGDRWGYDSEGFFFSSYPPLANYYASHDRDMSDPGANNGAVYPVYIRSKNPLVIDEKFLKSEGMGGVLGISEDSITFWDVYQDYLLEVYNEGNYDSIIIRDESNKDQLKETMVAFEPHQIRSVYSTFHPEMSKTPFLSEMSDPIYDKRQLLFRALSVIGPRVATDPIELRSILGRMSQSEILQGIDQYEKKPFSPYYVNSIQRATEGEHYTISLDGTLVGKANTLKEAKSLVRDLKKTMLKKVEFYSEKSLRMPDLGVWSADLIAKELKIEPYQYETMSDMNCEQDKLDFLKSIIFERGYDSIVYKNEVENSGIDSFIALSNDQLKDYRPYQETEMTP